jgi:hypothetical protein
MQHYVIPLPRVGTPVKDPTEELVMRAEANFLFERHWSTADNK